MAVLGELPFAYEPVKPPHAALPYLPLLDLRARKISKKV